MFCADRYTWSRRWRWSRRSRSRGCPSECGWSCCSSRSGSAVQQRKGSREAWRGLVRDARAAGVGSLLELERERRARCPRCWWSGELAQRELEVLYADPETEFARDVWDLRKVGLAVERNTVVLDFSAISAGLAARGGQALGSWAGSEHPGQQPEGIAARSRLLLSESLALREDGGREKSALARADMRAFVERLAPASSRRSAARNHLSPKRRPGCAVPARVPGLRAVSAGRAATRAERRVRGLAAGSAQAAEGRRRDGEGRALPQVVIDQLLSDAYLDRLRDRYGEDMLRDAADPGRHRTSPERAGRR